MVNKTRIIKFTDKLFCSDNTTSKELNNQDILAGNIPQGEGGIILPSPIFTFSKEKYLDINKKQIKVIRKHDDIKRAEWLKETIDNYERESKVLNFVKRINNCKELSWGNIVCGTENCNQVLTKRAIKLTCLSPFCNELECIKNRIRCNSFRLKEFKIISKVLYNFVIGFEPLKIITKKDRILRQKVFRYFMNDLNKSYEKQFGSKLYSISVRDLNKSEKGLRLHYHIATLPVKDFRKFTSLINASILKTSKKFGINLAPSFSGYKKTSSTLSYFAKRVSGVFGHNKNGDQQFTYKNIMNAKDYLNTFYKTKALNFFNLKFRIREANTELINMLNVIPIVCPKCKILTKNNTLFEKINLDPPPDPTQNQEQVIVEVVCIK